MLRYSILLLTTTLFLAAALPAHSDTILDDFQVNTVFPGHPSQTSPYSVADSVLQIIYTAFLSSPNDANSDVALSLHDYDLSPMGQTTYLNVREGTYLCSGPRLAISNGGVGAAWIEKRSPDRVYFRPLDDQGNPISSPVRVEDDFSLVPRDSVSLTTLADGYLVVWYDQRDSTRIWAQKVDFNGNLIGANFPVQTDPCDIVIGLEAQTHPSGRVLVSWVANGHESWGQWFDENGNFSGINFEMSDPINTTSIGKSLVRFNAEGLGLLYQYEGSEYPYQLKSWKVELDSSAQAIGDTIDLGNWYANYWGPGPDEGFTHQFPDIVLLPQYLLFLTARFYSWWEWQDESGYSVYNVLESEIPDTSRIPWGRSEDYQLCRLSSNQMLYTRIAGYYSPSTIGMRAYDITTLDSSASWVWIDEPGYSTAESSPKIVALDNGNFRIAYSHPTGYGPQVFTRYFNDTGTPLTTDTLVSRAVNNLPMISSSFCMEKSADERVVILYNTLPGNYGRILGVIYSGSTPGSAIIEYNSSSGYPYCDINDQNTLMLYWSNSWTASGFPACQEYFRTFSNLTTPITPVVNVGITTHGFIWSLANSVSLRNSGRFIVCTLQETYIWYWPGENYQSLIGDSIRLLPEINANSCSYASSVVSPTGYWITWMMPPVGQENRLYLANIDSLGVPVNEPTIASTSGARPVGNPDIAISPSGKFAICWQDTRNDSGDIYCRQFNPDGSFFGREYGVNSDAVGFMQKEPALALGPNDQLYFTWTDYRNPAGQGDIFAKVIEWDDALAVPPEAAPLPREFVVHPPFPNPFNPVTKIRFELPVAAQVALRVFDIGGRLVYSSGSGTTPTTGLFTAGTHEIVFDGSGLPSGVYIYRLTMSGSGATPTIANGKMVLMK